MKKHPSDGGHRRARALRQQMTEAEKAVWRVLRLRQIGGHRFRRQVPLGRYIADFVCHEARLIVEIDGGQHDPRSPQEIERCRFLEGQGYRILRFWNHDVLGNLEGVLETLTGELSRDRPLPTLPHRGGGVSLEWLRFAEFSTALLYDLLRFRQAIFVVEQSSPYPDLDGLDQIAQHLLLRRGGALAGYLRLIPRPDERRIAIGRVAVAPAQRRKGLARLMMAEALARARRDHPDCAVTLNAQSHLAPFYEGLGFRATSAPCDDYGVPHVEMTIGQTPA